MIGIYQTTRPENVEREMSLLIDWYNKQRVDILILAVFHAKYESIHPFQDGNGRTGRLILFRECLKKEQIPIVIEDRNRDEYLEALKEYREKQVLDKLMVLFKKEQEFYWNQCQYFM